MIHFDITSLEMELSNLEKQTANSDFWNDTKNSSIVLKKITRLKARIQEFENVKNEFDNIYEINNLLKSESDEELEKMGIQDGDTVRIFDFEFEWTR